MWPDRLLAMVKGRTREETGARARSGQAGLERAHVSVACSDLPLITYWSNEYVVEIDI